MASTILESELFADAFGAAAMRDTFSDHRTISLYIEVEIALADAEARLGVIPEWAAVGIREAARPGAIDREALKRGTEFAGYPVLPLVEQLTERCGEAGMYLHWGATTQDIMDTALVLQLREGLALIEAQLDEVREAVRRLAETHRDTAMAGRTHLQHAAPVTFGYKAGVWLAMLDRHADRLQEMIPRLMVVQLGGAAGTLASLGGKGLDVQRELAAGLELGVPPITWHTARDGLIEAVQWLALSASTLGKIAQDTALMSATEFGEVSESFAPGRGASSTMPQKRNPIACEIIAAATRVLRHESALMLDAAVHDFERATGAWQAEWFAIPRSFITASGAFGQASAMLGGLEVHPERMARNLALTRGLIASEAVMMALAPHTGRQTAHDLVYEACREAERRDVHLAEALSEDASVNRHLDKARIAELTTPDAYLGLAPEMVDRLLESRPSRAQKHGVERPRPQPEPPR